MDCPALTSSLYTPKIIWYQTDVAVILRVMLQDVKNYFLRVEADHLQFSTIINDKGYYISLYLFGSVIPEKTTHINMEREIKINLMKAFKWAGWLRLQASKQKIPHIALDPDHIYETNWTKDVFVYDAENGLAAFARRNNINIMPDVPSTDEEESEDEEMNPLFL
ncbi:hypothetical protein KPH14_008213 [Odynerus spinipes]|uniref:RNA helicase n=1 Tax=Odynerus spinipes TaxID=1348599 RepID=A0AAD9RGH3_9HYME|nr:hypothetical protein KPH14_008213 [Odynerus spinipes]